MIRLIGDKVINNGTTLVIDGKLVDIREIKTINFKKNIVNLSIKDEQYELVFKTENSAIRFVDGLNI